MTGFLGAAVAADKAPAADKGAAAKKAPGKLDPSGDWSWSSPGRDGQTRESKLSLKLDGEKLTGSMAGRDGAQHAIQDGKVGKDGTVSFKIERDRNGQKVVATYSGKLEGDLIKGTQSANWNGENRDRPWEAKRAAK